MMSYKRYQITEGDDCWIVEDEDEGLGTFPTAVQALNAVKAAEKERTSKAGRTCTAEIEWQPETDFGRRIVRAISRLA